MRTGTAAQRSRAVCPGRAGAGDTRATAPRHGRGTLATKADLAALETRLTVRFYGALLVMAAVMIAATAAFTKL